MTIAGHGLLGSGENRGMNRERAGMPVSLLLERLDLPLYVIHDFVHLEILFVECFSCF